MIGALGFVIALIGLALIVTTLTGTTGQVLSAVIGGGGPPPGTTTAPTPVGAGT